MKHLSMLALMLAAAGALGACAAPQRDNYRGNHPYYHGRYASRSWYDRYLYKRDHHRDGEAKQDSGDKD